jgi:hypothetical protein
MIERLQRLILNIYREVNGGILIQDRIEEEGDAPVCLTKLNNQLNREKYSHDQQ